MNRVPGLKADVLASAMDRSDESLSGCALDAARALFGDIPFSSDDMESRRGYVVFANGASGVAMVLRSGFGDGYADMAGVTRDMFAGVLRAEVGPLVRNKASAGFKYDLQLGGLL